MGRDRMHSRTGGNGSGGGTVRLSAGCLSSFFQFFDLHHFQMPVNQQQSSDFESFLHQQPANASKGIQAPRNSLELAEQENLNIPVGIQIKTGGSNYAANLTTEDFTSVTSSPGTKTPSVVARLMGLELLPQCSSPSFSSMNSRPLMKSYSLIKDRIKDDIRVGIPSLPETPTISSARRSDSDYHRSSLQINKENVNKEFNPIRAKKERCMQQQIQEEHYAKQVKQSMSRQVGLDITNNNRNKQEVRRDENLIPLKLIKKSSKDAPKLLGIKQATNPGTKSISSSPNNHQSQRILNSQKAIKQEHMNVNIIESQNFNSSLKNTPHQSCDYASRKMKQESFVHSAATNKATFTDKKSKKFPLACEHLNATKLPEKQSQVLSSTTHSHQRKTGILSTVVPDYTNRRNAAASLAASEYKGYIRMILKRAGIANIDALLDLRKWHAPSHPLSPSIFYYLEHFHPFPAALSLRCNRKLIFRIVDELLADYLKPFLAFKPRIFPIPDKFDLLDGLCNRIKGFPATDCQVLEDINKMIGDDLGKSQLIGFLDEVAERLASEIEDGIIESLVRETVAAPVAARRREKGNGTNATSCRLPRGEMSLEVLRRNRPRGKEGL